VSSGAGVSLAVATKGVHPMNMFPRGRKSIPMIQVTLLLSGFADKEVDKKLVTTSIDLDA